MLEVSDVRLKGLHTHDTYSMKLGNTMHYFLYRITNTTNGKIYVGVHETQDLNDGYMGSGELLQQAMRRPENKFTKEILERFKSSEEMYAREAEVVDWAFIQRDDVYNIRLGGKGGWGHMRGLATVKTPTGKILKVSRSDPRFISGELVGNTKGLRYFNDGTRTYRLRADQQPQPTWKPGRAWSASGRKWYNDGTQSFYLKSEEAEGLHPGRLALANTHLKGRGYFNDGVTTFRLHRDDPKVQHLQAGRLLRSQCR
jgi:hypothetical protein